MREKLRVFVVYDSPIPAPVTKGTEIAQLVVEAPGFMTVEVPLKAAQSVDISGPIGRLKGAFTYMIFGASSN